MIREELEVLLIRRKYKPGSNKANYIGKLMPLQKNYCQKIQPLSWSGNSLAVNDIGSLGSDVLDINMI